jgi:hypothetical protein
MAAAEASHLPRVDPTSSWFDAPPYRGDRTRGAGALRFTFSTTLVGGDLPAAALTAYARAEDRASPVPTNPDYKKPVLRTQPRSFRLGVRLSL